MSFKQLPGLILSRRIEFILSKSRIFFSPRVTTTRNQSTDIISPLVETGAARNWAKGFPFLPLQSKSSSLSEQDRAPLKQPNYITSDEDRKVFIEQYLSHELSIDIDKVRSLYFLCENEINENYPNKEAIIQLCSFIKLFFTADDLYYNPRPLIIPFSSLYNRVLILKELGFRTFNTSMVESTFEFLQMTPNNLCQYFNYLGKQKCFDSLCKTLNIVGDDKKWLTKYILTNYGEIDDVTISNLRLLCIAKYLSSLLKLGFSRVENACTRANRNLAELSLNTINLNVNYLTKEFHYPSNKIIHNGLFASLNPDNLQKIATALKSIVGQNTYEHLIVSPLILKTDYNQILSNFELIKRKCNGKFYLRSVSLLLMGQYELQKIVHQIETNVDIKQTNLLVLGCDYLAMNHAKILERIETIKQEEIPFRYVPLSFYQCIDANFDEFINDMVSDAEMRIRIYIEDVLELDYEKIKHQVHVIPGINARRYTKQNAKRIIEFFISMNIPKERIIDSLYLILFDYKHVRSAYFNACARYDKTLHADPNFFEHIFDYLLHSQN